LPFIRRPLAVLRAALDCGINVALELLPSIRMQLI
jgi:hypothetical protein